MKILALDPGLTTGWAKVRWDGTTADLVSYGEIAVLGEGIDGVVSSVWDWLNDHAAEVTDEIAFEGPLHVYSIRTAVELHEVRGVIREWCIWNEIAYAQYHPSTVKAAVTRKAGATKKQVADAMKALYGVPRFPTDHASDAVAIATTHLVKTKGFQIGNRTKAPQDSGPTKGRTRGTRGGDSGGELPGRHRRPRVGVGARRK